MGFHYKSSHALPGIPEENWRHCSVCPIRLPNSYNAGTLQYCDGPLSRKPRDYKQHNVRARFGAAQTDPQWWNGAEPIWVRNQKQKGKIVSYTGSSSSFQVLFIYSKQLKVVTRLACK